MNYFCFVLQGKEITLKVVELVNKVGEALSSISHIDREKTVVKSRFMDIVIYKEKPENFGGQNISEQSTSVFIPDSARGKLPNSNDSLSLQVKVVFYRSLDYTITLAWFSNLAEINISRRYISRHILACLSQIL